MHSLRGSAQNPISQATFSVQAAGSPTLTYQWKKNGTAISGQTLSSFTISSAQLGDIGNYSVTVNNPAGTVTSANAYLSVGSVLITEQPKSQIVVPNSTVQFNVNTIPSSGVTYHWQRNQADVNDDTLNIPPKVSGATAAALVINDVTHADRGSYSVMVQGTIPSAAATLDICPIYPLAIHQSVISGQEIGKTLKASFSHSGINSGDFGWLTWDSAKYQDEPYLEQEWTTPLGTGPIYYQNPINNGDHVLGRLKSVYQMNGSKASVVKKTIYDLGLVGANAKPITVVVWDQAASSSSYRIYGFANIKLRSISTSGNDAFVTFDYLGISECDVWSSGTGTTEKLPPEVTISTGTLAYTENDPPKIIDSTATVVDSDSPTFAGGSLTLDFTANGLAEDSLSIQNEGKYAGQIGLETSSDGTTSVTYGGTPIATVVGYLGHNTLTIKFTDQSNRDAVQALLQKITYYNLSDNPSELTRTLRFTLSDGSTTPVQVTKTISVTDINDQPTLADIPDITVTTDGTQRRVQLTGISAGGGENQTLTVSGSSGNTALIPSVAFDTYTSPSATATIKFTPGSGSSGVVILTATVTDSDSAPHGGPKSISKSFKVTLVPPPPASDIPPTITMPSGDVNYVIGTAAKQLDTLATLTDPDSADFNSGTLTVSVINNGGPNDTLGILTDSKNLSLGWKSV